MNGAESLVVTLERLGVRHAFQVVGLGLLPLAEALYRHRDNIEYVTALNETNLGLIAQGYARASHRPAFLNVYHASGTALAMMAVTTAWADQVPLVLSSTVSSTRLAGRDQYAAVPRAITEMTGQFTKWSAEVPAVERIPEFLERAFQIASTPPFGPVHLAFPMDFWTSEAEQPTAPIAGVEQAEVVDEAAVARLAHELASARHPLLVAGGEVARYGAVAELVALAEASGSAVAIEPKVSDLGFPTRHPQFIGKLGAAKAALEEADLVVLLGVELTESGLTPSVDFPPGATVAHVTVDPLTLRRQFVPALAVLAHPRPALSALTRLVTQAEQTPTLTDERAAYLSAARADLAERLHRTVELFNAPADAASAGLSVAEVASAVDAARTPDTIVVNHSASGEPFIEDLLGYTARHDYFGISAKASAQGWGGPAAIGIQLARPGSRVIAILGDGGFMFTSSTVYTAARYRLPITYVILNNGGWRDIAALARVSNSSLSTAENEMHWTFHEPEIDHAGYARSLGLTAWTATTRDELDAALRLAVALPTPTLIEVMNTGRDAQLFAAAFTGATAE